MKYAEMTKEQLEKEYSVIRARYDRLCEEKLSLNLTRGKPEKKQLDLSNGMYTALNDCDFEMDGIDVRNYGLLDGLPSCKRLFSDILGCAPEEIIIGGNSSLNLMYDLIAKAYTNGLLHSERPWCKEEKIIFLCPVPGYDRHFNISISFGMECIPVPLHEDGPDMDIVEELVKDPLVKGMWCTPKYSNPDGYIYSSEVRRRIASLNTAAPDFALIWDNAYAVHCFDGTLPEFPDMIGECRKAGHPDMIYEFASLSKVTFAGSGIAALASSQDNLAHIKKILTFQTIGFEKVAQYLHVKFLKDKETILKHMEKHAAIMKPKFDAVQNALETELGSLGIAEWTHPKGGYFVSLYAMHGTAKRINSLCAEAGVAMTKAGATYPHGYDPDDSNLRIAPSYPELPDVVKAMQVLCVSARLAALELLLGKLGK